MAFYWEQLFDVDTGDLKPELRVEYETQGCNLLIINFIQVHPKFRGHGIGLVAIERIVDVFGHGCALAALKSEPLQFTPYFAANRKKLKQLQAPDVSKAEAFRKLSDYWARAGFKPYGESGICVKGPKLVAVETFRMQKLTEGDRTLQSV